MSPYGHWRRRIVHWISAFRARKILPTVKYVHLLHNDKFAKPFVDFLNRNFPTAEHLVLCQRTANHPFPTGPNVLEVRKFFKGIDLDRPNIDKIICHSLFINEIVDYFYEHTELQRAKAYWSIFGGDLYDAPRDEKNDFVRANFKGYVGSIDKEYAVSKYGMKEAFYDAYFYHPISCSVLDKAMANRARCAFVRVQVNNSADRSTPEALRWLARFKDEKIIVTTVLSYGDMKMNDEIINLGRSYFGNRFEFLSEYVSRREYAEYMASNDVLILNQPRQQAVGNTAAMLYMGKKVYIRNDVSTNVGFKAMGLSIYDTQSIDEESWGQFTCYDEKSKSSNIAVARKLFFDEHSIVNGIKRFLLS